MTTERNRARRRTDADFEPRARYCSITSSDSKSDTSTSTTNIDARVAGGDGSINVSNPQGGSLTLTLTDAGSIGASFGFARDALKNALDFAGAAGVRESNIVGEALEKFQKSEAQLADAYATAKAGEQKVLVGVAIAIVATVAVAALRGRKA